MKLIGVDETGFDRADKDRSPDFDLDDYEGRRAIEDELKGKRVKVKADHRNFVGNFVGCQIMSTVETDLDAFPVILLDMSSRGKPQPIDVRTVQEVHVR